MFDNILCSMLSLLGFGVSKTLLEIRGIDGHLLSLGMGALSAGIGYSVRLLIDFIRRRFLVFMARRRQAKKH